MLRAEKEKATGKTVTVAKLILTSNAIDSRSFRVGDASGQFHYTEWNTFYYTNTWEISVIWLAESRVILA